MIELIEGAPGAGKSLFTLRDRALYWLQRSQRPLYVHMRGVQVDRWASLLHLDRLDLEQRMTVWPWGEHDAVPERLLTVQPNGVVVIDEAQFVFRSRMPVAPAVLQWFETHRHHGIDVYLTCQDYRQITSAVTRLVENTIQFVRLSHLGADTVSQGRTRGNPEATEIITRFPLKFGRKVFPFYASYADGVAEEVRLIRSIWRSPFMLTATVAAVFVLGVLIWKPWSSLGQATAGPINKQPGPVLVGTEQVLPLPVGTGVERPPKEPARITIIGRGGFVEPGEDQPAGKYPHTRGPAVWKYLLSTGELLTADQLAAKYGMAVQERRDPGDPQLLRAVGEGIEYGPGGD